jgi:hypothetical protein
METSSTPEEVTKAMDASPELGADKSGQAAVSSASTANGKPPVVGPKNDLKDYTTELPMFDLEDMLAFAADIQTKGLEKAKMPDVAKGCGYESASSTSFYRKLVAARHFGLLVANGAELTERTRDYLAPTADNSKPKALTEAVQGIAYFSDVLAQHGGKRLNIELIGNDIARKLNVSKTCGKRCAKVFETSARFAGLLSPENLVLSTPLVKPQATKEEQGGGVLDEGEDTQKHTLYLDKMKRRKFHMVAPLSISTTELERIKNWLTFTIIADEE